MEIEKTLTVSAPPRQVWELLLNPQVMAGAVPGMQSIDVISPTEYTAVMHQKISFISARFKLNTKIVEQKAPEYMRVEGTGEDSSVASSLKQTSEVFLTPTAQGGTELRIKVNVDVLGRLGAFGLSIMKTKADRMWDEFGANLAACIEAGGLPPPAEAAPPAPAAAVPAPPPPAPAAPAPARAAPVQPVIAQTPAAPPQVHVRALEQAVAPAPGADGGWWSRLLRGGGGERAAAGHVIRVEVRQIDKTICVEWPASAAPQCREWLQSLMK